MYIRIQNLKIQFIMLVRQEIYDTVLYIRILYIRIQDTRIQNS
jgi:hypothetical protein